MKKRITSIACGLSAVSLLAFALVACDSDSPSAAPCNCNVPSSSSRDGVLESSSDETVISSESVTSSETGAESSSSAIIASNSSVVTPFWSGIDDTCLDVAGMCPPCEDEDCPTTLLPCNSCTIFAREYFECGAGELYVCGTSGTWSPTGLTKDNLVEMATDIKAGPLTESTENPRVVKVVNTDGSVTFRDDDAKIYNGFVVAGVRGILTGDTLYVKILYPDSPYNGGPYNGSSQQGVITFTLSKDFANVKYYRYIEDVFKKKTIFEEKMSSSSVVESSSSRKMECITMSQLCPPCDSDDCPIPFMPCNQCYWEYGAETFDCETNERYVCSRSNTWDYTCHNLIDSTGNIAEDSCEYNFSTWVDCKTNKPFVCKEGRWERLPEEYSWIDQKCDSTEAARFVDIEYETEKGSIAKVSLGFYCNVVLWQQSSKNLPERTRCEIEDDKVTINDKTYQCVGGKWEVQ